MKNKNNFLSVKQYMEQENIGKLELIRRVQNEDVDVLAYIDSVGVKFYHLVYMWKKFEGMNPVPIYSVGSSVSFSGFVSLTNEQSKTLIKNESVELNREFVASNMHTVNYKRVKDKVLYGDPVKNFFTIESALDVYRGSPHRDQSEYKEILLNTGFLRVEDNEIKTVEREKTVTTKDIKAALAENIDFESVGRNSYADYIVIPLEKWEKLDTIENALQEVHGKGDFQLQTSTVTKRNTVGLNLNKSRAYDSTRDKVVFKKLQNTEITLDDLCVIDSNFDYLSFSTDNQPSDEPEPGSEQEECLLEGNSVEQELLRATDLVKSEFWGEYDLADPETIPDKYEIEIWIKKNFPGLKSNQCKAIEVLVRAGRNRPAGRKPNS